MAAAIIHTPPATFFLSINGINVSETFNKYLIQLIITDTNENDDCDITLDDTNGQLAIPPTGGALIAGLGWADTGPIQVFKGTIETVTSIGSRDGGRLLKIHATGANWSGDSPLKTTQNAHLDQMSVLEAAQKFGEQAGLTIKMAGDTGSKKRDYWAMGNETFPQWADKLAKELGLNFKIQGKEGVFTPKNSSTSASGGTLATIECVAGPGANIISWYIVPEYTRPQYKSFTTLWYDAAKAVMNDEKPSAGASGGKNDRAIFGHRHKAPDKEQAADQAQSDEVTADQEKKHGKLVINGEPAAKSQGKANITGARPGVDGLYLIEKVTHTYQRGGGYTTDLDLLDPGV